MAFNSSLAATNTPMVYGQMKSLEGSNDTMFRDMFWYSAQPMFQSSVEGKFLRVNPAFASMAGYRSPEELLNRIVCIERDFYVDTELRKSYRALLDVNDLVRGIEFLAKKGDGTEFWVSVHSRAVRNIQGDVLFYEGTAVDVTLRKEVEEQLAVSNKRLREQTECLRDCILQLQQFSDILAHDLSSPIRMINSYLVLIERRCGVHFDSDIKDYFRFATEGCSHLKDLIDGLLEYSQVRKSTKSDKLIFARSAVDRAVRAVQCQINETKTTISVGDLPRLYMNESLLALVFQNLIANAIKYRGRSFPKIEISCSENETHFEFLVRDNGRGISEQDRAKVFCLYQRGQNTGHVTGRGIGLAVCKKVISGYGGEISLTSELGKGTTIRFTAPKQLASFVTQPMRPWSEGNLSANLARVL